MSKVEYPRGEDVVYKYEFKYDSRSEDSLLSFNCRSQSHELSDGNCPNATFVCPRRQGLLVRTWPVSVSGTVWRSTPYVTTVWGAHGVTGWCIYFAAGRRLMEQRYVDDGAASSLDVTQDAKSAGAWCRTNSL